MIFKGDLNEGDRGGLEQRTKTFFFGLVSSQNSSIS